MKRFAVAALVAVAVAFASQQSASAGGGWYWKGNIGVNFSWDAVMGCFGSQGCPNYGCPAPCYSYPAPYYAPAPYAYGYDPSANQGYAQGYAAPAAPVTAKPAAPVATTTQIGYYPYNYNYTYNYGYGYNYGYQAPSYWYGR